MSTPVNPTKRQHSLHGLSGGPEFLDALEREGIDLDEIVGTCLRPGAQAGVLLGGSLAEGVGNEASDVDLLILLENREDLQLDGDSLILQAGRAVESLLYRKGIEFNLEIFLRADVERLMDAFVSMAPALYDASELKRLPLLQPYDLRFLHRLKSGWILRGEDIVDQWQDEFMTDLLRTYLAARYFNNFDELFEDAASMLSRSPTSGFYTARTCVEQGLLSALAQAGFTSQSKKWLLHWCESVQGDSLTQLRDLGVDLLLTGRSEIEPQAYIERVHHFGSALVRYLEEDSDLRRATHLLRSRIAFIPFESRTVVG